MMGANGLITYSGVQDAACNWYKAFLFLDFGVITLYGLYSIFHNIDRICRLDNLAIDISILRDSVENFVEKRE